MNTRREGLVQVKAELPLELKRRVKATLALRGETFTHWLIVRLEAWLKEIENTKET